MFTALADKELNVADSLIRFIALSPCVLFNTTFTDESKDEKHFQQGLYKFQEQGIHAYKGPNWADDLKEICRKFDYEVCDEFKKHARIEYYPGVVYQPTSIKNLVYWW